LLFHKKESITNLSKITLYNGGSSKRKPRLHNSLFYLHPVFSLSTKDFIFKVYFININQWRLQPNHVVWKQQSCTDLVSKFEAATSQDGLLILVKNMQVFIRRSQWRSQK
jgi:hypothetical protein